MEKGDLYTVIGSCIFVLVIAILVNPAVLSSSQHTGATGINTSTLPGTTPTIAPVTTLTVLTPAETPVQNVSPAVTPSPQALPVPYRIYYTKSAISYPVFKLPDNMESFGASDIPWREDVPVEFAYVNESRGGLTEKFSVPYTVWMLNTTVVANRTPQYAKFDMVLCDARTGNVIEGMEILNHGTGYKMVQTSGIDMYMIVSAQSLDYYQITLETPLKYYEQEILRQSNKTRTTP